jgi:hypothetical protein
MQTRRGLTIGSAVFALLLTVMLVGDPAKAASSGHTERPDLTAVPPVRLDGEVGVNSWIGFPIGSGYGSCPAWYFCMWEHIDAAGLGIGYTGTLQCGDRAILPDFFRNEASSTMNNTSVWVTILDQRPDGNYDRMAESMPGFAGNLTAATNDDADAIAWLC